MNLLINKDQKGSISLNEIIIIGLLHAALYIYTLDYNFDGFLTFVERVNTPSSMTIHQKLLKKNYIILTKKKTHGPLCIIICNNMRS